MIGDIILWIKQFVKQQTCIHEYKTDKIGIITGLFCGEICSKCEKRL